MRHGDMAIKHEEPHTLSRAYCVRRPVRSDMSAACSAQLKPTFASAGNTAHDAVQHAQTCVLVSRRCLPTMKRSKCLWLPTQVNIAPAILIAEHRGRSEAAHVTEHVRQHAGPGVSNDSISGYPGFAGDGRGSSSSSLLVLCRWLLPGNPNTFKQCKCLSLPALT